MTGSPADERYEGMTCQDCSRGFDEVIDFLVPDPIWNYVMGGVTETTYTIRPGLFDKRLMPRSEGGGGVVCLACFDKRARELGVSYRDSVIVFGVECWMGGNYNGGVPVTTP